ncbi:hypothetical protein CDAR_260241 [Caerostris darwini]|uniref:Ig-like domain-containing protein n=1 Tax=Caerostris darwini TaxID=1538125 RepID=A0AAV4TRH7_9ARAC|nr:hypothetical protein CDAR_260241 [Caerostris darwini]
MCHRLQSLGSVAWSKSVRVTELKVPSTAIFGESVTLICSYDLGSEELYVVKWYKDDLEFYRYEPKDDNQSVYFPQPGIDMDCTCFSTHTQNNIHADATLAGYLSVASSSS